MGPIVARDDGWHGSHRRGVAAPDGATFRPRSRRPARHRRATSSAWRNGPPAPGTPRGGTSSRSSMRRTANGFWEVSREQRRGSRTTSWLRGVSAAPVLLAHARRPDGIPRPVCGAGQGLDRPLPRPLAHPVLGHRHRHGRDGRPARSGRRRAGRPLLRRPRDRVTTRSRRRMPSLPTGGSSASSRWATRPSGCAARHCSAGGDRWVRCCTSGGSARRGRGRRRRE